MLRSSKRKNRECAAARSSALRNDGIDCAHREQTLVGPCSQAVTQDIWRRFAVVVTTHPDVYLVPPAPAVLGDALQSTALNVSLLACSTRMFS